jgi:hypothetical protein
MVDKQEDLFLRVAGIKRQAVIICVRVENERPWTWVTNLSVDMGYTFFRFNLPR